MDTAVLLQPALAVLTPTIVSEQEVVRDGLATIAALCPLALAGDGADENMATAVGARMLEADLLTAAATIAAEVSSAP